MLSSFYEKTGKKGLMISAVDLLKGIAVGAVWITQVEGADAGLHTNYQAKGRSSQSTDTGWLALHILY